MLVSDEQMLDFIEALARIREMFRGLEKELKDWSGVVSSSADMDARRSSRDSRSKEHSERDAAITIGLDADVAREGPDGADSMGVVIEILRIEGIWTIEAEIGWSGGNGWARLAQGDVHSTDFPNIVQQLPAFVAKTIERYKTCLRDHIQGKG